MSDNKIIDGLNDALDGRLSRVERRYGFTTVCVLPNGLGAVTKLQPRGDRIVAKTASGIDFIVPFPAHGKE